MSKILVLVEGKKTEPSVLNKYLDRIKEKRKDLARCKLDIVSFNSNIYVLYKKMKECTSNGIAYASLIDILRLMYKQQPDEKLGEILKDKYPYIYLIFDFEYQDTLFEEEDKERILQDMLSVFNDETENGLLLINYPMVESYRHWIDPKTIYECYRNLLVSVKEAKDYKVFLHKNNCIYDINRYNLQTFETITRAAISEIDWIINKEYGFPDYKAFSPSRWGSEILSKQIEKINESRQMFVLPFLFLLFVSYFGKPYYDLLSDYKTPHV